MEASCITTFIAICSSCPVAVFLIHVWQAHLLSHSLGFLLDISEFLSEENNFKGIREWCIVGTACLSATYSRELRYRYHSSPSQRGNLYFNSPKMFSYTMKTVINNCPLLISTFRFLPDTQPKQKIK